MEINEVKVGDMVTFTHNKKKVTGKVLYRHGSDKADSSKAALMGHVNVQVTDNKSYPVTVHVSKLKPALKEETMEQNSENISEHTMELIDYIDSANHIEAEKKFNELLQDKIDAILGVAKEEVAKNMFNTQDCAECDEQNDEAELEEAKTSPKKAKPSRAGNYDNPRSPDYLGDKKRTRSAPNKWVKRPPGGWPSAEKATNEEVEQIDELSPATIKSYEGKAVKDLETHDNIMKRKPGFEAKGAKRHKGIQAARAKMKEEVEIEEGMVKAANKAAKKAYVQKLGHKVSSFSTPKAHVQSGRNALKNKPTGYYEETEVTNEALKGGQHKIDANKNGKVDAHDFKLLRKKKGMKEAAGVEEAVVIKPTPDMQRAIDAYKKKKAASSEVPKTRETPAVRGN